MSKPLAVVCLGLVLIGCGGRGDGGAKPGTTARPLLVAPGGSVASVNGADIPVEALQRPLFEAHGVNVLLNLAQLEIAKQAVAKKGLSVTEADVQQEMKLFLDSTFRENNAKGLQALELATEKGDTATANQIRKELDDDNQVLLDQLLERERSTRAEFDLLIRTQAHLRKLIEPTLQGAITEKMLEDGFRFRYGEKVEVRHIQLANPQEVLAVRKLLSEGKDFADVAKRFSRNAQTGPMGGLIRPFSRQESSLPEAFKDVAFSLKVGEVSDVVNTAGASHLIQLERRIDPVAVKFETVKESVRRELYDAMLANGMKQLRADIAQTVLRTMVINDPTLKAQFDKRMAGQRSQIQGKEEALKKLTEERQAAEQAQSTQPATAPTTRP